MRRPVQAVILAGGRGTRLRPLTDTIPKPMIPFNGRPFLQHLIELLKEQGFQKVLLLLGYLPQVIQDHFKDGSSFGIQIEYSVSSEDNDTGTRLKLAKDRLDPSFMLMYCDNYWPLQMDRVWDHFMKTGAHAQITVYNNQDAYTRHNVRVDQDGMVLRYDKSAPQAELRGTDIGFMLLRKEVVDMLPDENINFEKLAYPTLIRATPAGPDAIVWLPCGIVRNDFGRERRGDRWCSRSHEEARAPWSARPRCPQAPAACISPREAVQGRLP